MCLGAFEVVTFFNVDVFFKVGAPPQVASLLEEIGRENHPSRSSIELGADPQLDNFMVLFVCLFALISCCNFLGL